MSSEYVRGFLACREQAMQIVDESDGYLNRIEALEPEPPGEKCPRCGQPLNNGWKHNYKMGYGDFEGTACSYVGPDEMGQPERDPLYPGSDHVPVPKPPLGPMKVMPEDDFNTLVAKYQCNPTGQLTVFEALRNYLEVSVRLCNENYDWAKRVESERDRLKEQLKNNETLIQLLKDELLKKQNTINFYAEKLSKIRSVLDEPTF